MALIPLYDNSFVTDELLHALSDKYNNEDGIKMAWVRAIMDCMRSYGANSFYEIHPCNKHTEDGTITINFPDNNILGINDSFDIHFNIAIEAKKEPVNTWDFTTVFKSAFAQRVVYDWEILHTTDLPAKAKRKSDVVCVLTESRIKFLYVSSNAEVYWDLMDYFDSNYDNSAPCTLYKRNDDIQDLCKNLTWDTEYHRFAKDFSVDTIVKKLITDCIINKYGNKSGTIA